MNYKQANSDIERISNNIHRLTQLCADLHSLSNLVVVSHGKAIPHLQQLIRDPLVRGRTNILKKVESAYKGENNQTIPLDDPMKVRYILREAEYLTQLEIIKEQRKLRELTDGQSNRSSKN